jgi:hypothetical protein
VISTDASSRSSSIADSVPTTRYVGVRVWLEAAHQTPRIAAAPASRTAETATSHDQGVSLRAAPGSRMGERRGVGRAGASSVMLIATTVSAAPEGGAADTGGYASTGRATRDERRRSRREPRPAAARRSVTSSPLG